MTRVAVNQATLDRILHQWDSLKDETVVEGQELSVQAPSEPHQPPHSLHEAAPHRHHVPESRAQLLRALEFVFSDQREKLDNAIKV